MKDVYAACRKLMDGGVTINRPPRDGNMAFVRSPDGISIELLQEGAPLPPQEPWSSMPNTGRLVRSPRMRVPMLAAIAALLSCATAQAQTAGPVQPAQPAAAPAQSPPSASGSPPALVAPAATAADWLTPDPANTVLIETTKGRMILELRPDLAPLAVARIKTLIRRGYYDKDLFYRVIDRFMAQTGDKGTKQYRSDLPNLKAEFTFAGKPAGYFSVGDIPGGDVGFVGAMPVRLDTPAGGAVKGWPLYCPGVAAMAHFDDPNTANSQIFFLRDPAPSLEKTFTAFGRVIVGADVARQIAVGEPPAHPDKMIRLRILSDIPASQRPDVQVMDTHGPAFAAVIRKVIADKGAGFTMCDIEVPAQVR